MLYNLDWLATGKPYPPKSEAKRISRYKENAKLFSNEQFGDTLGPYHNTLYGACLTRISECVPGFSQNCVFPVVLNYQRAVSLKTADLVCGEAPIITGKDTADTDEITNIREITDFNSKLYSTVLDLSRYGDAIWRVFKNEDTKKGDFTLWNPGEWFPILRDDGTLREKQHVICWRVNIGTETSPVWELRVQIHDKGFYEERTYSMDNAGGTIGALKGKANRVSTGLKSNAVIHLRNIQTSDTVYGYDDYMPIDSLLSEILTRIGQISKILDIHASPAMSGPASMLEMDPKTGKRYLKTGKFFAVNPGEEPPEYLTWDGQLTAAFKELEVLLQQLYMLSELGEALLGTMGNGGQAISGTAMRFKLANPLIKARRVANGMTLKVKQLIAAISELGFKTLTDDVISVEWEDGLPDDPREMAETAKLVTGADQLMPREVAIAEFFDKTASEAADWVRRIDQEAEEAQQRMIEQSADNNELKVDENSTSVGSGNSGSIMNP